MISAHALTLIHKAIDTRALDAEQALIDYVAVLEDAAPLLPQLKAEADYLTANPTLRA